MGCLRAEGTRDAHHERHTEGTGAETGNGTRRGRSGERRSQRTSDRSVECGERNPREAGSFNPDYRREGRVAIPSGGKIPRYTRYLDESKGLPVGSVWDDINPINSQALESLGYPTQKPLPLLERIIKTSSNENDIVLDAFCGCGTALVAAQNLKRGLHRFEYTVPSRNLARSLADRMG
jgi:hypothetical protein